MTNDPARPEVQAFFDPATWTVSYVAWDPATRDAVAIDTVLDYDGAPSRIHATSVGKMAEFIRGEDLRLHWILDTHAHADHLTGARALQELFPEAKVAIGARIREVQMVFASVFNLGDAFTPDGRQFDRLLEDGERFDAGSLSIEVIGTPGHTPACVSYLIGDAVFTGDTLFMPDYGVGRCDFPAGSAEQLYDSIVERLYGLPDATRVFVGHDYQPGGREVLWQSTIGEEKQRNVQLPAGTPREDFVERRRARDKRLGAPRLLFPSVQFNIHGGRLPPAESNGTAYLKIPIRRG
jgi:glyoxylase-like metal-dependent hydrolase (beta-lactamase superfamily II)